MGFSLIWIWFGLVWFGYDMRLLNSLGILHFEDFGFWGLDGRVGCEV